MAPRKKKKPAANSRFPMRRIPPPEPAPDYARGEIEFDGVSPKEANLFKQRRKEILALVDAEVERYATENTALPGENSFPDQGVLNGEFYIARESYKKRADPVWFQISIMVHCRGHCPWGVDDYLGLDIWIRYDPEEDRFTIYRNTDSSSI
jgi:hypothetical protein